MKEPFRRRIWNWLKKPEPPGILTDVELQENWSQGWLEGPVRYKGKEFKRLQDVRAQHSFPIQGQRCRYCRHEAVVYPVSFVQSGEVYGVHAVLDGKLCTYCGSVMDYPPTHSVVPNPWWESIPTPSSRAESSKGRRRRR